MANNLFDYRSWITQQKGNYKLDNSNPDHFELITDYAVAQINFYTLDENEPEVVEFRIENNKDDDVKFFLHFQLNDEEHAQDLFRELVTVLSELKEKQKTKILLCCTSGLTTSFFTAKLNEVSETLGLDYEFNAVSISEVYEVIGDYKALLVAPQVGYEERQLKEIIKDKPILRIPTAIFGSYDAGGCIEFLRSELEKEKQQSSKEKKNECEICEHLKQNKKFLLIAVAPTAINARIQYRIYDHGEITTNQEVIKRRIKLKDILDIIETQNCECEKHQFDAISIAIPGIIKNGKLELKATERMDLQNGEGNFFNIQKYFEEKVSVPVIIDNNVNCAALGWYENQEQYESIVFVSQPQGFIYGGEGIIVNGELIRGSHCIAGETKFLMDHMSYDFPLKLNPFQPETQKKLLSRMILANIAILDPEAIVVRSEMVPDMEELKREISKAIPEELIPPLYHIDNFNDQILAGQVTSIMKHFKHTHKKNEEK